MVVARKPARVRTLLAARRAAKSSLWDLLSVYTLPRDNSKLRVGFAVLMKLGAAGANLNRLQMSAEILLASV
jgi:hypothetical protein